MRHLLLILPLLLLAACSPLIPANTGVEGQVSIGPMCPVVRQGQECPDRPYQARLTIQLWDGKEVRQITTEADGRFHVPLYPARYILHPQSPPNQSIPFAADQPFTVVKGEFTRIKLIYDSGIR
jgi:hypothetical protein